MKFKGVLQLDLATGKSLEWHTCEACKGSWRVTLAIALKDKTSNLARLTHPQSLSFDSPNCSILTLSIDISLRDTLAKSLSQHIHICEKVFWCLGNSSEGTNSIWLMQWAIVGSGKLKKTRFDVTLLKQEAWKA